MICSEFIYTSWKNGGIRSGFTTFAKGNDVTAEEADEIVERMLYIKPVDLTDYPTDEEIDSDFPRNGAYFRLRSGRCCMSQAVYVGKDYAADENARWANYMIHAFIFDETDGFFPMGYLGSDLFKRRLTSEEREYERAVVPEPVDLPEPDPDMFGDEALTEILDLGEEEDYFIFLQAIVDRAFDDSCIIVGISDRDKINRWMQALPIVLPEFYLKNVTYGTYMLSKNPKYKINFLYNPSSFDSGAEIACFPGNAILFFESGFVHGVSDFCEYLREYKKSFAANYMFAYRLKDDMDRVYAADNSLSFDNALNVTHYLKRDVEYFTDFPLFDRLTVYLLNNKGFDRISETAMYMIQNSAFSDVQKRSLFFIGDVFLRLEENEKDVVRQEFFAECFRKADSSQDFVDAYTNNPMVTGEHSPLTYEFFRQFIDMPAEDGLKEKAIRFVVELEGGYYNEFDNALKSHFFKLGEVYFMYAVNRGEYDVAVNCLRAVKLREEGTHHAGMTDSIVDELLGEDTSCWYYLEFVFDIMQLVTSDRDLYWSVFKKAYDIWWKETDKRRELIKMYVQRVKRNDPTADGDIGGYSAALGFEDFVPTMELNTFSTMQGKTIYDFANTFNTLFGKGCTYGRSENACNTYYAKLAEHLDNVRNAESGNKRSGDAGLYAWISEMSGFIVNIESEKATESLLDFVSCEIIKNMTLVEFSEMFDVNANFIFVRNWSVLAEKWVFYPDLIRYLDMISVRTANFRNNFFPYYVDNNDTIIGTASDKKICTFIECVTTAMLKDSALTAEDCDVLLSPFLLYRDRRFRKKTFESLVDGFGAAADAGNIEPFYWMVQFYAAKVQYKSESDSIEEDLIFPILAKHKKAIMNTLDELPERDKRAYSLILDYLDGLTFNVFNKAKRVKAMRMK